MSDSYRTLFLFVKNYTNGTVLFVYGVHPLRHAEPHALLECQAEGAVAAVAAEHRQLLGGDGLPAGRGLAVETLEVLDAGDDARHHARGERCCRHPDGPQRPVPILQHTEHDDEGQVRACLAF